MPKIVVRLQIRKSITKFIYFTVRGKGHVTGIKQQNFNSQISKFLPQLIFTNLCSKIIQKNRIYPVLIDRQVTLLRLLRMEGKLILLNHFFSYVIIMTVITNSAALPFSVYNQMIMLRGNKLCWLQEELPH